MKHRTALRNPPYPLFQRGELKRKFFSPFEKEL